MLKIHLPFGLGWSYAFPIYLHVVSRFPDSGIQDGTYRKEENAEIK